MAGIQDVEIAGTDLASAPVNTVPLLSGRLPGRDGRVLSLAGMLVAGLVLAVLVIPEFGPWVNGFHHH